MLLTLFGGMHNTIGIVSFAQLYSWQKTGAQLRVVADWMGCRLKPGCVWVAAGGVFGHREVRCELSR